MAWDGVIMVALLIIFTLTPLELAYDDAASPEWTILGYIVDLIFWIDIVICFRTTFFDAQTAHEVTDQRRVAMHYITDFFFIDITCSLPGFPVNMLIEKLLADDSIGSTSLIKLGKAPRVLKVLRSAKLLKMLRIMKVGRIMADIRVAYPKIGLATRMLGLVLGTGFFLHINACAFSLVAFATNDNHQDSWVYHVGGLGTLEWKIEYINALYWAATTITTVGYGDINPQNEDEKLFCIFSMCLGVGVYGYIIGVMTNIATTVSQDQQAMQSKMGHVSKLTSQYQLPSDLKMSLMRYFRIHYQSTGALEMGEKEKMFSSMPHPLLLRCRDYIMSMHLSRVAFFSDLLPKFFPAMIELLMPLQKYGRVIAAGKQPHQHFFVLLSGHVAVQKPRDMADEFDIDASDETDELTRENINKCKRAIHTMFEARGTKGTMDVYALQDMINDLAMGDMASESKKPITLRDAMKTMKKLDTDKSGTVELGEFASWYLAEAKLGEKKVSKIDEGLFAPHEHEFRMNSEFSHYGNVESVLKPVCIFGTYSAFDYGPSKYNYVCEVEANVYSVDADKFQNRFQKTPVVSLIQKHFLDPLEKFGEDIDLRQTRKRERRGGGPQPTSSTEASKMKAPREDWQRSPSSRAGRNRKGIEKGDSCSAKQVQRLIRESENRIMKRIDTKLDLLIERGAFGDDAPAQSSACSAGSSDQAERLLAAGSSDQAERLLAAGSSDQAERLLAAGIQRLIKSS